MNIFQQITDYVKREYSTFTMNNNWIGSVNGFGSLNSIYHKIVIPSDTWKLGHNLMVKLPPLVSPAFTRIKGIVNSYYCSFASVWNYWNSFISDKPEDVFLSRSLTQSYKGKFVEPCCNMATIATICKIAKGFFDSVTSYGISYSYNSQRVTIELVTAYEKAEGSSFTPSSITWSVTESTRRVNISSNVSSIGSTLDQYAYDRVSIPGTPIAISLSFADPGSSSSNDTPNKLGFFDWLSYFIFQCQEVERNLSNHGIPTDLIAKTPLAYYSGDFFNLLPFMCESSIWQNFYRDEQNQSPEFDYREVNGCVTNPTHFIGGQVPPNMPYGWNVRLLGIPPNVSTGSDYWWKLSSEEDLFSLLTGFQLEPFLRDKISSRSSATDVIILPKFYNGLLCLKYRNFEKDYFTSACVDPNFGGVSVQVPNTIDALRTASKLEEFLEVSASARDFYNFMKHLFGTNPESTRYQKPLLLGTQVVPVQISEQLQTSQTTTGSTGSPLGERAGVADGYGNSGTINHYFNEHGIVVSFLSFVLDSQYMQGMPYEFWHHLQLDYPFPQFANLGAESIPLKEVYYSNVTPNVALTYTGGDNNGVVNNSNFVASSVDDLSVNSVSGVSVGLDVHYYDNAGDEIQANVADSSVGSQYSNTRSVFGYTPRYSRWKFAQDVVAGQMRNELEFWHTFRRFNSVPFISNNFVSYMNAGFLSNLNRIFAVVNDNSDKFVVDVFNNGSVRRCLPLTPSTTID